MNPPLPAKRSAALMRCENRKDRDMRNEPRLRGSWLKVPMLILADDVEFLGGGGRRIEAVAEPLMDDAER